MSDYGVQDTANDAIVCKRSAVDRGYFKDAFIDAFVHKPSRRIPLIHRGYYLRKKGLDSVIDLCTREYNVISLGAGLDTTGYHQISRNRIKKCYVEIDQLEMVCSKRKMMEKAKVVREMLQFDEQRGFWTSKNDLEYHLVDCDLSNVVDLKQKLINIENLNADDPVLILAECVLAYVDADMGDALLSMLSGVFKNAMLVMFDPFDGFDGFSRQMEKYFSKKGCRLLSWKKYPTLKHQQSRLVNMGWKYVRSIDLNGVDAEFISENEKLRIEKVEPFDEFADLVISNAHYGITLACVDSESALMKKWTNQCQASIKTYFQQFDEIAVRFFQKEDEVKVRDIFKCTHLEFNTCKSVSKFVEKCLRTDMKNIEQSTRGTLPFRFWVAIRNNIIVGCVAIRPYENNSIEVCRMGVCHEHRRFGIGTALLNTAICYAQNIGANVVHLETLSHMKAANEFYQSNGFSMIDEKQVGKLDDSFTITSYAKTLHPISKFC